MPRALGDSANQQLLASPQMSRISSVSKPGHPANRYQARSGHPDRSPPRSPLGEPSRAGNRGSAQPRAVAERASEASVLMPSRLTSSLPSPVGSPSRGQGRGNQQSVPGVGPGGFTRASGPSVTNNHGGSSSQAQHPHARLGGQHPDLPAGAQALQRLPQPQLTGGAKPALRTTDALGNPVASSLRQDPDGARREPASAAQPYGPGLAETREEWGAAITRS